MQKRQHSLAAPIEHDDAVNGVVFSPDSKRILTASVSTARLWDAGTAKQIGPAMQHGDWVKIAVFSPGGKWILTASDSTARLWEAGTAKQIGPALQHHARFISAVFSADGKRILAKADSTAWLLFIGGDLDIPSDLFIIQANATTGYELNIETNEIQVIPAEDWFKLKKEYNDKAREHYKICKYPEYNLWSRFNTEEAKKIRAK